MSDGRLLVRVAAAQRAEASLPAYVEDALAAQHAHAAEAERAAVLARATGRTDQAARHEQEAQAARHEQEAQAARDAAERLTSVHQVRAERFAATIETCEAGRAAREELTLGGHTPGHEPDRTTAEEWLVLERAARQADDAHRQITEADLDQTARERADVELA